MGVSYMGVPSLQTEIFVLPFFRRFENLRLLGSFALLNIVFQTILVNKYFYPFFRRFKNLRLLGSFALLNHVFQTFCVVNIVLQYYFLSFIFCCYNIYSTLQFKLCRVVNKLFYNKFSCKIYNSNNTYIIINI